MHPGTAAPPDHQALHAQPGASAVTEDTFINDLDAVDSGGDKDDDEETRQEGRSTKDQDRIMFYNRKAGVSHSTPPSPLSFQAYELSALTGTQVLLLVVSETGLVYTFTTAKFQPLVTSTNASSPPRSSHSCNRPSASPNRLPDPLTLLAASPGRTITSPVLHVPSRSPRASLSPRARSSSKHASTHPTGPFPLHACRPPHWSFSAWVGPLRVQIIYSAASLPVATHSLAVSRTTKVNPRRRCHSQSCHEYGREAQTTHFLHRWCWLWFRPQYSQCWRTHIPSHPPIPPSLQYSPSHRPLNTPSKAPSLHTSRLLNNRSNGLPRR